jgi:hypothetical protein
MKMNSTISYFSIVKNLFFVLLLTGLSFNLLAADSKRHSGQLERQKKTYTIPGPVVISAAKRHGYQFFSTRKTRSSKRSSPYDKSCEFMGMHWTTRSSRTCNITGFSGRKQKCRKLRKGWSLKEIKLKGSYVWTSRPANTPSPQFKVKVTNNSSKTQVLNVDKVALVGPIGPSNSWEDAFSHCSDPNYQD